MAQKIHIALVETRLGQPAVIGAHRSGDLFWSSIDRQPAGFDPIYLTWTGLARDLPTETRLKTHADGSIGQIHGGNEMAVYAYPIEHYGPWREELGEGLGGRSFGENWRLFGIKEDEVHIGDVWEFGEARLEVSKPRSPCVTLCTYFGDRSMIKRMRENGLCGWYLRVLRPGLVSRTGTIEIARHNLSGPTVAEAFAQKMHTVQDL